MKYCKSILFMALGAGVALMIDRYGSDIVCLCDKMMKKEKELVEDGLDLE